MLCVPPYVQQLSWTKNCFTKACFLTANSGCVFLIKQLAEDHTGSGTMQFRGQALSDQGLLKASKTSEIQAGWKKGLIALSWQSLQLRPNFPSTCRENIWNYVNSYHCCAVILFAPATHVWHQVCVSTEYRFGAAAALETHSWGGRGAQWSIAIICSGVAPSVIWMLGKYFYVCFSDIPGIGVSSSTICITVWDT